MHYRAEHESAGLPLPNRLGKEDPGGMFRLLNLGNFRNFFLVEAGLEVDNELKADNNENRAQLCSVHLLCIGSS